MQSVRMLSRAVSPGKDSMMKGSFSKLAVRGRSVGVVVVCVCVLYMCYTLGVSSRVQRVTEHSTEIIINDRRAAFIPHQWYNLDRDNTQPAASQYSDVTWDGDTVICDVHTILRSIEQNAGGHRHLPHTNCSRIVYNRVPKCGSRTVLSTFKALARNLGYQVIGMEKPSQAKNFYREQDKLISFIENFTKFESPFLFSQHVHYINFTSFHLPPPVYINVIRDPLQRQISHYYYRMYGSSNKPQTREDTHFNMTLDECIAAGQGPCYQINELIPFFCGQEKKCRQRSGWSLAQAKRVVQDSVLVVGFMEDLPAFMEVLEFLLPQYFTDASHTLSVMAEGLQNRTKTAKKPQVSDLSMQVLREHLQYEYDFYKFAKQRFYNLLSRIRTIKADSERTPYYKNKRDFYKWWRHNSSLG